MHVRKGVWRNFLFAVTLVTLALPLSGNLAATPAHAISPTGQALQPNSFNTTGGTCNSAATATVSIVDPAHNTTVVRTINGAAADPKCYVSADPRVAFNALGFNHTVTFTCGQAVGPAPAGAALNAGAPRPTDLSGGTANAAGGVVPGCYDLVASVTDETTGDAATFTAARCGENATTLNGSTVNCAAYASPLCPVGGTTTATGGGYCTTVDTGIPEGSQMMVVIDPGAPHSYLISFEGYTPLLATCGGVPAGQSSAFFGRGACLNATTGAVQPACPAGFLYQASNNPAGGFTLTTNVFVPPFEAPLPAPDGVCEFTVQVEKKYVEITNLTITGGGACAAGAAPQSLIWSEALKSFFGRACTARVTATGVVVLKTGVNCASEPPANGTPAGAASRPPFGTGDFPPGSFYQCVNGALSVVIPNIGGTFHGIPITLNSGPIPITLRLTGPVGISQNPFVIGTGRALCAGNGNFTLTGHTGDLFVLCPTGPGTGTVQACIAAGTQIDTQPAVCSNTLSFTYILPPAARVVPYVRWAGEKQVLTKCFGAFGLQAGAPVEFTLEGAGAQAQAALIPVAIDAGGGSVLPTVGSPAGAPGPNTGPAGSGGGAAVNASQNTVWTVTDAFGCASVIVYAASEGVVNVDASLYSTTAIPNPSFTGGTPSPTTGTFPVGGASVALINEHAFEIYYLKFDHIDLENINLTTYSSSTLSSPVNSLAFKTYSPAFDSNPPGYVPGLAGLPNFPFGVPAASFKLPNPPGTNGPGASGSYSIPVCNIDYVRAMVHGYFELPGDPSGRPAANVTLQGTPTGAGGTFTPASSYVLPAGRWVLPEDWPVLATFAGYVNGRPNDFTPSSVFAWDLNNGWSFNPGGEQASLCYGPGVDPATGAYLVHPSPNASGAPINNNFKYGALEENSPAFPDENPSPNAVSYGPCFSQDARPQAYSTAPDENAEYNPANIPGVTPPAEGAEVCSGGGLLGNQAGGNVAGLAGFGLTVGIGPFDITQACTNPYPLTFSPAGSSTLVGPGGINTPCVATGVCFLTPVSLNSTYLPNGTLNQWDAPMPPAQVSFGIVGGGPGYLGQVNKTGLYVIPTDASGTDIYTDPFYAEAIPASPLIPPIVNNGGYLWDTFGFRAGTTFGPTVPTRPSATGAFTPGESPTGITAAAGTCPPGTSDISGGATPPTCAIGGGTGTATAAECTAAGGTFEVVTPAAAGAAATGNCILAPLPATTAPGVNLTPFGSGCPATVGGAPYANGLANGTLGTPPFPNGGTNANTVEVVDATGFAPGMTVSVYLVSNGQDVLTNLHVVSVDLATNTITFAETPAGCLAPGSAVFFSEQTLVTIPGAQLTGNGLAPGDAVSIFTPGGATATTTVASVPSLNGTNTIPLNGSEALARALGNCILSRSAPGTTAPLVFGQCESDTFLPAGSLLFTSGAGHRIPITSAQDLFPDNCNPNSACNQGPYPFWQWVPNFAGSGCTAGFTMVDNVCQRAIAGTAFLAADCATFGGTVTNNACVLPAGAVCPVGFFQQAGTCSRPIALAPFDATACKAAGGTVIGASCNLAIAAASRPKAATVYSDNHGEAIVSLQTGVTTQLAPIGGACPPGYNLTPNGLNCLLNVASLGTATAPGGTAFQNIKTASSTFSQATPGCTQTVSPAAGATPTATAAANATPAPVVGATGPLAGQICVNNLGGIEFGAGAVLGTTNLQVIADYPYFRGLHPPVSSGTITKVFTSLFHKDVTVTPLPGGIAGPAGTTTYTVTITAVDICGNPIVGEPVNVFALGSAGAIVLSPIGAGGVSNGTNAATVVTGPDGTATLSLEVLNTALGNGGLVIKVVFPLERLERFVTVVQGVTPGATATVLYPPGYNQVGGPVGSNFGSAEALFSWNPAGGGSYGNATASAGNISSAPPTCAGYWAYFASATAVSLPATSTAGQTAACTLAAGWNLVGNPFASPAALPAGVTAYHFNGTAYDTVSSIPVGGAVWIFNDGTLNTVTLTAT